VQQTISYQWTAAYLFLLKSKYREIIAAAHRVPLSSIAARAKRLNTHSFAQLRRLGAFATLPIHSRVEMATLEERFQAAVNVVQKLPKEGELSL
jgi:hypothetical protein